MCNLYSVTTNQAAICGAMRRSASVVAPWDCPISVEYLRLGLDIGSDPRTLHLTVYQERNKYDGSESATAGKDKVAFVRRVVVALPGHFFTFSPSSTSRRMASGRPGQVVLLPAPVVKLFGHLRLNANQNGGPATVRRAH